MLSVYFMGTSDAQGVPRMLCACPVCSRQHKRNIRSRPSMLVKLDDQWVLIDTSPDFRQQFLRWSIVEHPTLPESPQSIIPATVLFTHAHHDHISGLGDFADLSLWHERDASLVSPPDVIETLKSRYPYLVNRRSLRFLPKMEHNIGSWKVSFHQVNHGHNGYSYGIRFSSGQYCWAYVSDSINLTAEQQKPFENLDFLILGTSFWDEQAPMHTRSVYSTKEALLLIHQLQAKQIVFTHLSHDIDYDRYSSQLPSNCQFAYDGLRIDF